MITRKDYERLAEILKKRIEPLKIQILKEENNITKDRYKFNMLLELIGIAEDLADFLKEDNPSFIEEEYLDMCGCEK